MMLYKKNTYDDAEVLPRRLTYPKMAAAQPTNNAHVIRNKFSENEVPVAAAQRDDEESIPSIGNTMTRWRGNTVSEKEAKALRYVFDDLQDHFSYQCFDPRVRFNNSNLEYLGNTGTGKWFGDLDFTYNITGNHCNLSYIGMDVCVDLAPKLVHKHGQAMWKEYGSTWLYVYLPQLTFNKFKSYVKFGTGWDVSDERTVYDPNRDMVAIEAKLQSGQPKTSFWAAKDKVASGGAGDRSFSRVGTIQDVRSHSSQQRIHRGVGIFSVSMEVKGTPNFKPSPYMDEADLCFTLVSLRTWGTADDGVAPIVYVPRKWQ